MNCRAVLRASIAASISASIAAMLGAALGVAPAHANGRLPSIVSIHPRPGSEDLALWSTWGFLLARGDRSFRWMCENALKVGGAFDPDIVFRADGSIVITTFEGVLINKDGCTFEPTSLGAKFISQIAEGPDGALYAAAVEATDGAIYKSTDGGATFPSKFSPGMPNDWWESLEVAPSSAQRLYLSGFRFAAGSKTPLVFRSDDGGASFAAVAIPQAGTGTVSDTSIVGIGRQNPDLVFAKVTYALGNTTPADRIYRSTDAGATWTAVLTAPAALTAFEIRRDGTVIAATVSTAWSSNDSGATFTEFAPGLQVSCLKELEDGTLLACGQNYEPDFMAVASSTDARSWNKVFRFSEAAGPVDCAVGTLQCDTCQLLLWCGLREQLGIEADPTTCALDGPDGSTCGGPLPQEASGCCGVATGGDEPPTTALLAALGALIWWRRPRRRR